ncbi:MAG: hypothetical protein LUF04_08330 [Bacteroides sp.]|nr:hypothetical protein [Bacteroides sp.]
MKNGIILLLYISLFLFGSCANSPKDTAKALEVAESYMNLHLVPLIPGSTIVSTYPLQIGEPVQCIGNNDRYLVRSSYLTQKHSLRTEEMKHGKSRGIGKTIELLLLESVNDAIGKTYETNDTFFYLVKGALRTEDWEYIRYDLILDEEFTIWNEIDWKAIREKAEEWQAVSDR